MVKKLAYAYYEGGQLGEAFPPLRRYSDGNPKDLDARIKLGTIYLMGRAPDKAREQAEAVLAKQPGNLDGLLLLAETAETPKQIQDALARIEGQRATLADPDRVGRALALLYARNQDLPRAEQELKGAVASKPDSPDAHIALARLHLGKRDLAAAEKEFKAAADLAPPGSFARLQLADFYLLTRRIDDATAVLKDITTQAPDAFPAWLRLGELAFAQGKLDEAQQDIDKVLQTNPEDVTALIIQSRIQIAKREATKGRGVRHEGGQGGAGERPGPPGAGGRAGGGRQPRHRALGGEGRRRPRADDGGGGAPARRASGEDGGHRGRGRRPQGVPGEAAEGPARVGGARSRAAGHPRSLPGRTRPSARRPSSPPRAPAGRSSWAWPCAPWGGPPMRGCSSSERWPWLRAMASRSSSWP